MPQQLKDSNEEYQVLEFPEDSSNMRLNLLFNYLSISADRAKLDLIKSDKLAQAVTAEEKRLVETAAFEKKLQLEEMESRSLLEFLEFEYGGKK